MEGIIQVWSKITQIGMNLMIIKLQSCRSMKGQKLFQIMRTFCFIKNGVLISMAFQNIQKLKIS